MRAMFRAVCSDRKVQRKSLKIREEFIPLKSLGGNTVQVQVRSPAPIPEKSEPKFPIGKGFGFLYFNEQIIILNFHKNCDIK